MKDNRRLIKCYNISFVVECMVGASALIYLYFVSHEHLLILFGLGFIMFVFLIFGNAVIIGGLFEEMEG